MIELKFKKLNDKAILPTRAKDGDAGLDIYAIEDMTVPSCRVSRIINEWEGTVKEYFVKVGRRVADTGLAVEIPYGYEGQIRPRSGLAFKEGLDGFIGTIDAGYRGEIKVILYNTTDRHYKIKAGDRIAQLVVNKIELPTPEWAEELSESARGENGFGSSGK